MKLPSNKERALIDSSICRPLLNQIALSVIDLEETERWFREGLGFIPASGSRLLMSSPMGAKVQGLPKAAMTCWWLIGRNRWFQLEMFQYRRPMAKLMPADFRPCDTGYTRMGVHVLDFDRTLTNVARLGSAPIAGIVGERGQRRACVRSPDGVYVEIMEADPLPDSAVADYACNVAVRSITLSTSDLAASVAYLTAVTGREPSQRVLHEDRHEALWGLAGAQCDRVVFDCGDILFEVVHYTDPVGKPWPKHYRICDQGIQNVAFGVRSKHEHSELYRRVSAFGATAVHAPIYMPNAGMVYVNDPLGFSIEMTWVPHGTTWGFVPKASRPFACNQRIEASVTIAAPLPQVWQALNEHDEMARWIGFDTVKLIRAGAADRNGYGAERRMHGKPGAVVEQIVGVVPERRIRYRVIEGSPFSYHLGDIVVSPAGEQTTVTWSIRFRSKVPLLGGLLRRALQPMLSKMLLTGLKPHIERQR